MKNLTRYKSVGNCQYPSYLVQLPFAIFSAHVIITYEEKHSYAEILTSQYYYIALLINSIMAYVLLLFVFWINRILDFHFPWRRSYAKRMPWQISMGILFPLLLDFGFASGYFAIYGINIFETVYFSRYLLIILFMLIAVNFYLFYYWHHKNKSKAIPKAQLNTNNSFNKRLEEIACIFIEGKYYFYLNFRGEKGGWPDPLLKTISHLDQNQFMMINRSIIVNRSAIAEVKVVNTKKTDIRLVKPINLDLTVSQRENAAFKKWWILPEQD